MGLADREYMRRRDPDREAPPRGNLPGRRPGWIAAAVAVMILLLLLLSC